MPKFYRKILDLKNMYLIKKSNYFDEDYYHKEYPEVKGNLIKHYYYKGYKLGNNPSNKFNNNYYLDNNYDVRNSGVNPLLHYLLFGKNEGREIREYLGMTISELNYFLYHKKNKSKIYLKKSSQERITLFLGNNLLINSIDLFLNMFTYCIKKNIQLRVIYQDFDVEKLFLELKKQKVEDFSNLIFLKWNPKYLLEIDDYERIICDDFNFLSILMNTKMLNSTIYYYANNHSSLTEEEQMILSFWIKYNNVVCIGNAKINYYNLIIENNKKKINNKICNICFDFGDMSTFMLQLYNDFFINRHQKQTLKYFYKNNQISKTICFENNIPIEHISNLDNINLVIRFNYHKDELLKDISCINIYFEKTKEKIKFIDLNKFNFENNIVETQSFIDNFKKILEEIGLGD